MNTARPMGAADLGGGCSAVAAGQPRPPAAPPTVHRCRRWVAVGWPHPNNTPGKQPFVTTQALAPDPDDDIDDPRGLDLGSVDLDEIVDVADPDVAGALELLTLLATGADHTAQQYLTTVPGRAARTDHRGRMGRGARRPVDAANGVHRAVTAPAPPVARVARRPTRSSAIGVGDVVGIERDETRNPATGSWPRYRGPRGTVVDVNRAGGGPTEYGVLFTTLCPTPGRPDALVDSGAPTWFFTHEIRRAGD